MTAHFGGRDESDTIIQKYKAVIDNAEKKAYKCVKSTKPKQKHLCAQGECPGKSVLVLPQFAGKACPAGPTILHEAIHNAGACGDIDRDGKKYPPSKSEDNAWSYEYFASEVDAGAPTPKLPDGTPKAPR